MSDVCNRKKSPAYHEQLYKYVHTEAMEIALAEPTDFATYDAKCTAIAAYASSFISKKNDEMEESNKFVDSLHRYLSFKTVADANFDDFENYRSSANGCSSDRDETLQQRNCDVADKIANASMSEAAKIVCGRYDRKRVEILLAMIVFYSEKPDPVSSRYDTYHTLKGVWRDLYVPTESDSKLPEHPCRSEADANLPAVDREEEAAASADGKREPHEKSFKTLLGERSFFYYLALVHKIVFILDGRSKMEMDDATSELFLLPGDSMDDESIYKKLAARSRFDVTFAMRKKVVLPAKGLIYHCMAEFFVTSRNRHPVGYRRIASDVLKTLLIEFKTFLPSKEVGNERARGYVRCKVFDRMKQLVAERRIDNELSMALKFQDETEEESKVSKDLRGLNCIVHLFP